MSSCRVRSCAFSHNGNFLYAGGSNPLIAGFSVAGTGILTPLPGSPFSSGASQIRDLDGDSAVDVVWRNKVTGENFAWLMSGFTITAWTFLPTVPNLNWDIVGQ